jgi:uncharacterized protein
MKKVPPPLMKTSLDHLPSPKRRELARVMEIMHEELADALAEGAADFRKRGRILKIILFGSYARGDYVDEPHTMKGYRSDYDILVIVNNRKLTEFARFWYKAADRLLHDAGIRTPVGFIVHSRREVNTALKAGQYFFSDIRRDGIVLYELDDEPLAEPALLSPVDAYHTAKEHFDRKFGFSTYHTKLVKIAVHDGQLNHAAFLLHQSIEQAYSTLLLTLTNYGPPSHNLTFLRTLAEGRDRRLADAFPRDQQRYRAWFNQVNEAYVKARYSRHYEISEEALLWLGERTVILHDLVEAICREHLEKLQKASG